MFEYTLLFIFPAAMMFAAFFDLFTMTIPNKVSIALVAGFALVAPFSGLPWATIGMHVLAGALMLGVCVFMFWRGWMGGGDAKLLSAAALWIGFDHMLGFATLVAICGGLLAVAILLYRSILPPSWLLGQSWALRLHEKKGGIPYGIAIAAGAIWIYPSTSWFNGLSIMALGG
ncbi:MAG: prepilin peptidase [Pseudomonadota bacterium]